MDWVFPRLRTLQDPPDDLKKKENITSNRERISIGIYIVLVKHTATLQICHISHIYFSLLTLGFLRLVPRLDLRGHSEHVDCGCDHVVRCRHQEDGSPSAQWPLLRGVVRVRVEWKYECDIDIINCSSRYNKHYHHLSKLISLLD